MIFESACQLSGGTFMTVSEPPATVLDPENVAIVEPVRGSDIPVHLMYIEMIDGLYAPVGLRLPKGSGPFPVVVFAAGNGGGGMAVVRDFTQNRSWTQEQFLAAGYAVVWTRYRAEVDYAYDKIGKLVEDRRQRRQAEPRTAGIRGRHLDRKVSQDASGDRRRAGRLRRYEPRR
jgi:predicted dienelactone hydrolase